MCSGTVLPPAPGVTGSGYLIWGRGWRCRSRFSGGLNSGIGVTGRGFQTWMQNFRLPRGKNGMPSNLENLSRSSNLKVLNGRWSFSSRFRNWTAVISRAFRSVDAAAGDGCINANATSNSQLFPVPGLSIAGRHLRNGFGLRKHPFSGYYRRLEHPFGST